MSDKPSYPLKLAVKKILFTFIKSKHQKRGLMRIHKTIFAKYFIMCGTIILFSILFLGTVLLVFADWYFKNERYITLSKNARYAAHIVESELAGYRPQGSTESFFNILSNSVDASFFFTNSEGATIYCTNNEDGKYFSHSVPENILKETDDGEYRSDSNLGEIYEILHYVVGIPVVDSYNTTLGYVFASSPTHSLEDFMLNVMKMFAISAVAVLLLVSIVLYFTTLKITNPLKEMVKAAKLFGLGKFSEKIKVKNDGEIGELATALNNMAKDLSNMENARRNFTSNVSHELKTPITTIAGFIDGILDGTITAEQHKHYLRIVSEETQRLSRLVGAMLNLSKIEAEEIQLVKTDFNIFDIVARVVINLGKSIEDKNLEIRGLDYEKINACGDVDLIYQVVYNIVENAIKFANQDGYLEFIFNKKQSDISLTVRNSGQGISEEDLPRVFERFYKTDRSRGLDKHGVGLGLFIVRTIIDLHSGKITANSKQGEYTEIKITLPEKDN